MFFDMYKDITNLNFCIKLYIIQPHYQKSKVHHYIVKTSFIEFFQLMKVFDYKNLELYSHGIAMSGMQIHFVFNALQANFTIIQFSLEHSQLKGLISITYNSHTSPLAYFLMQPALFTSGTGTMQYLCVLCSRQSHQITTQ